MRLIGFTYTKISIEKNSNNFKDLKIETSMNIPSIEEAKTDIFAQKDSLLNIKFENEIVYKPNIAKISFEGNLLIAVDPKQSKEILKKWKDKKIDQDVRLAILNVILRKTNIKAIQLEEEMNLPHHFRLPSIQLPQKEEKK
jgi:hypothetical protein